MKKSRMRALLYDMFQKMPRRRTRPSRDLLKARQYDHKVYDGSAEASDDA
jgi:hypothetical protein